MHKYLFEIFGRKYLISMINFVFFNDYLTFFRISGRNLLSILFLNNFNLIYN